MSIPSNQEMNEALREFEAKNAEQKQQILESLKTSTTTPSKEESSVGFETDNLRTDKFNQEADVPKIVQLVMKWFRIEQRQAEYILLGFVVLAIIVSGFLFFGGGKTKSKFPQPSAEMLEQMKLTTVNQQ